MYALGRNVQYYDAPAVRAVVRSGGRRNYEFSAFREKALVASVPFQMRAGRVAGLRLPAATETEGLSHDVQTSHVLPRRRCRVEPLRGAGATLALPFLDAMVPAFAADRAPWTPPARLRLRGDGIVHKLKPAGAWHRVRAWAVLRPLTAAGRAPSPSSAARPRASRRLRRRHGSPIRAHRQLAEAGARWDGTPPGVEVELRDDG